ncbi:vacuolar protein sorting/targeting protein PEP1 [Vanrija albida]|uniref:Vacuolar protein sorting/targeting protein PEP1 n=1 Tax=Vanrija albida TaxID=181172 RepID=A0ABR3PY37_9TREE
MASWLLAAGLLALLSVVGAADPEVEVTRFANLPSKLFYFEDSTHVLMHDDVRHTVYHSADEGKTWKEVEDIGKVHRLIDHPHNKEMAFALGSKEKHYVTYNQGESWQSFETPVQPSLSSAPLSFHATHDNWILFQGLVCENTGKSKWGGGKKCWDETYYTKDAFRSEVELLLSQTSSCTFARSSKFVHDAKEEEILCIAFDSKSTSDHRISDSRLFRSSDWFKTKEYVDLGLGKRARGVVGLGVVSKFLVVAMRGSHGSEVARAASDPMELYVSTDAVKWHKAQFPHSAMPNLVENAYTIVESTTHSIAVDILTTPGAQIGTLFVSSSEGKYFVESLPDTNRNDNGIVDFEHLQGIEGVGIANVVSNRERVVSSKERKKLTSHITYDDGSNWRLLKAPAKKLDGSSWDCDPSDTAKCSLHVHGVTVPHNLGSVFSSTAPGFVMAVGSVGEHLLPYAECDTFLSTDAGVSWKMVREGAHKYEFGDLGSVLVLVDDEQSTDHVLYSYDGGANWDKLDIGLSLRATLLTTIPDSTSQKFLLLGVAHRQSSKEGRYAMVFLDFAGLQNRQCKDADFEKWYARSSEDSECLMGQKLWYRRRKLDAKCYVGNKFQDPTGHSDKCKCTDEDYECDFNYVRQNGKCVPVGPEKLPEGACVNNEDYYEGSSGYRLIPGNVCEGGVEKDKKVKKPCKESRPNEGEVSHVVHEFKSGVLRHNYFSKSQTILLHLQDGTVWQSSNEGYSWTQLEKGKTFLSILMHPYDDQRAYLLTSGRDIYFTKDTGRSWNWMRAPADANPLQISLLDFHPTKSDWLIFTGSFDCEETNSQNCRAVAYYSTDHGSRWNKMEEYVRNCQWARGEKLKINERLIICESYKNKKGTQRQTDGNPLQLVAGDNYYGKKNVLFDAVVGFTTFDEYLVVAQLKLDTNTLSLQVSLDGIHFSEAQFPPGMKVDNHAYTILESSTDSLFLHMTMSNENNLEWGTIFKSNSNGTYFSMSIEDVNRDRRGFADFEKMIGLDGIAMVNVVSNVKTAKTEGSKKLQTRITHNDGGTWKPMPPPDRDALGQKYDCTKSSCSLHLHSYTERRDPKATYSSPSAVGLMIGVGNVGEELAEYKESDVFLTRDGGFHWEEIRKDAHLWEYGDSGSIIVLVNDETAVDHVLYTTDEGLTWHTYAFDEKIRVASLQTVPEDTSRRFFIIGKKTGTDGSVLVHLDFSRVSTRKCELKADDPNNDDFELWSPSQNREEQCLFGRQTLYHRRIRDKDCYIGDQKWDETATIKRNCTCTEADFECEFNYVRKNDKCVLVDGAEPLSVNTLEEQCVGDAQYWYERTAYRKIPYSSCDGGERIDQGKRHECPGLINKSGLGAFFWGSLAILPFMCAGVAGWWYVTKGGRPGAIRLGEHRAYGGGDAASGALAVLASVPFFLIGVVAAGWSAVERRLPFIEGLFTRRPAYRSVPIDEDAEILGTYEDD